MGERVTHDGVKSIAKNAAYLFGARNVTFVLRGLYAVLLADLLGEQLYGIFGYSMAWYLACVPIAGMGVGSVLAKELGRDRTLATTILPASLVIRCCGALIAAAFCLSLGLSLGTKDDSRILLLIFCAALIGRAVASWANSVFTAAEKSYHAFRQDSFFRLVEVAIGIPLVFATRNLAVVALIHAATWWAQAAWGLGVVRSSVAPIRLSWDHATIARLTRMGIPLAAVGFLTNWMLQGPIVLFRWSGGAAQELGQLALAFQAFGILHGLALSVNQAALPLISRSVQRKDGKDHQFLRCMFIAGSVIGGISALLGWTLGPGLVKWVFDGRYLQAGSLLGFVCLLVIPVLWGYSAWRVLIARGSTHFAVASTSIAALLLSISVPVCVRLWGLPGVVAATGVNLSAWSLTLVAAVVNCKSRPFGQLVAFPLAILAIALTSYASLIPASSAFAFVLAVSVLIIGGGYVVFPLKNMPWPVHETQR